MVLTSFSFFPKFSSYQPIDFPATIDISSFPSTSSFTSSATIPITWGLTAKTIISLMRQSSLLSDTAFIPNSFSTNCLSASTGEDAVISFLPGFSPPSVPPSSSFFTIPPIIAFAIFPAPIKPIFIYSLSPLNIFLIYHIRFFIIFFDVGALIFVSKPCMVPLLS